LENHERFNELLDYYFSDDVLVRLRVSNAIKRIGKAEKSLVLPYMDRFIDEIAQIDQASTHWTLSQLFLQLEKEMTEEQREKALEIMKNNLSYHDDWIVLCQTMETLGRRAQKDNALKNWLLPHLIRLRQDNRKPVSKKASKVLAFINH